MVLYHSDFSLSSLRISFSNPLLLIRPCDLIISAQKPPPPQLKALTQSHHKAPVAREVARVQAPGVIKWPMIWS